MIKYEQPPNIETLRKRFPIQRGVLFAYAPHIYNPDGAFISEALMVHEQVHLAQQGDAPALWWGLYLDDPEFRLLQEFQAHLAEYEHRKALAVNRHERRALLKQMAHRLAAPLYGGLITRRKAAIALKRGYLHETNRNEDEDGSCVGRSGVPDSRSSAAASS